MRPVLAFTASMASTVSVTSNIDLGQAYAKISLMIPTMVSGSDVYLQGSDTLNGTYRRIFHPPTNTSATVSAVFLTSGVTNCIVQLQHVACRYVRLQLSTSTTDTGYTFQFICAD